jgi:hypothetical protein
MKKPPYYVTDARHFLMEEASLKLPGENIEPSLKCRSRPSRKPCPGNILATRETNESPIFWKCTHCGTGGEIHKWKGTQWDNLMGTVH